MKYNILRIIAVMVIALLCATLWYLYEFDRTSKKNIAILTEEKKVVEKRALDLSAEKKTLQEDAVRITTERDGLVAKLSEYETQLEEHKAKVREMSAEIDKIKAQIAAKNDELQKKIDEIIKLQGTVNTYKAEFKKMNRRMLETFEKTKAAQASAAQPSGPQQAGATLEPITVTAPQPVTKNFTVVDVNQEYSFIILDGGSSDNIKVGDSMCVFRARTLLGRVVVEKVGENAAVAKILYKALLDNVRKGDVVKY